MRPHTSVDCNDPPSAARIRRALAEASQKKEAAAAAVAAVFEGAVAGMAEGNFVVSLDVDEGIEAVVEPQRQLAAAAMNINLRPCLLLEVISYSIKLRDR